jgi:hypothetical protein
VTDVTVLSPEELAERRRRAKRAAVLLAAVAITFYVGFILLTWFRGSH